MAKREEKREHVLQAAKVVLENYGIRKLTLDDVAEKAGLATPSLYYYFKNKRELVRAVVKAEIDEITSQIDSAISETDGPEGKIKAIATILYDHANRLAALPGMNRMEHAAVFPDIAKDVEVGRKRIRTLMEQIIEEGNAAGIFDVAYSSKAALMLSIGLVGMMETAINGEMPKNAKNDMDYMMELLFNGFRKR